MSILRTYFQVKIKIFICKYSLKLPLFRLYNFISLAMKPNNEASSINNILMPPSCVYGMKKLDRDAFTKEIKVPAVDIPTEELKAFLKNIKPYILKMNNLQPVQGDGTVKKVLFNPILYDDMMQKLNLENVHWTTLTLSYENFLHDSIFKAVIPPDVGSVSSFSIIGHIIHLNLKPELLDYKYIIGEVFLDKNHKIKTVVNKAQTIESEYRNFQIELLAGEPNYEVTVKENGFQYSFDFSKVFWNPRLVNEHAEIVKKPSPADLIFDVFAGVGPFAIPLAKKKCVVHANDLNPDSYQWLCHNAKLNKVSNYLTAYNLDGREFIQTIVKNNIIKHWNESNKNAIHILMNLPASALEFLDAFQGLLKNHENYQDVNMPIIYCYFFLKKDEEVAEVIKKYFNEDFSKNVEVTSIRLVAPNKQMMRLTYNIPASVLFGSEEYCNEPVSKRIKLSV